MTTEREFHLPEKQSPIGSAVSDIFSFIRTERRRALNSSIMYYRHCHFQKSRIKLHCVEQISIISSDKEI